MMAWLCQALQEFVNRIPGFRRLESMHERLGFLQFGRISA